MLFRPPDLGQLGFRIVALQVVLMSVTVSGPERLVLRVFGLMRRSTPLKAPPEAGDAPPRTSPLPEQRSPDSALTGR